jgi:hypothetical protein
MYFVVEQRLHTYRTNWTLLLFASDRESETGDYTAASTYCQAAIGVWSCPNLGFSLSNLCVSVPLW